MIRIVTVVLATSFALPSMAPAQTFITGAQIGRNCLSRSAQEQTACNTYIAGALDQVANSLELRTTVCVPANTTLATLREQLGKFSQQRPEEAKGSGAAMVDTMIKTLYPCPAR